MAWTKQTTADWEDGLQRIIDFATKTKSAGSVVYNGGNNGNGTIYGASASQDSVDETFTLTCTGGEELVFTGVTVPATAGVYQRDGLFGGKSVFKSGTRGAWWSVADDKWYNTTIANIGTEPTTTDFELVSVDFPPVGTWDLIGTATGIPESTISGGVDGEATFSVVGSVSGGQNPATSGDPYSIDECSFTIIAGTIPWVDGDEITFVISAITAEWTVVDSDLVSSQKWVIMSGIGGGTDEIFVGFRTQTDNLTYFNMEVTAFTGYNGILTYDTQPGKKSFYGCMSNVPFEMYMTTSTRNLRVIPVIGTVYEGLNVGWFLPYSSPSQYTYPMFVGGSTDTASELISSQSDRHTNYWRDFDNEYNGSIYNGVSWQGINNWGINEASSFNKFFPDLLGNRVLYPCTMYSSSAVYGRLEGIYFITNGDGAVTTEDVVIASGRAHLCSQDVFRVGVLNIASFDLRGDI